MQNVLKYYLELFILRVKMPHIKESKYKPFSNGRLIRNCFIELP